MTRLLHICVLAPAFAALAACAATRPPPPQASPNGERQIQAAVATPVKVIIDRPGVEVTGSGVWLGDGLILSAMHLFNGVTSHDHEYVIIHGHKLRAEPDLPGNVNSNDIALLIVRPVPPRLTALPVPQICTHGEAPGAALEVVAFDRPYDTYASPAGESMYHGEIASDSTTTLFSHGVSGSPVYDRASGCLAGIISHFIDTNVELGFNGTEYHSCLTDTRNLRPGPPGITCGLTDRTAFTPATQIRPFIAAARAALRK